MSQREFRPPAPRQDVSQGFAFQFQSI